MAKIAFILLCHKDPDAIIQQAEQLTAAGDFLAIHFDARAKTADFVKIQTALAGNSNVVFAKKRIKCGWGAWSLVQATLNAINGAIDAFPKATHFYMLSGDCMPIKSAQYIHDFLDDNHADYIEVNDYFQSNWIKTGWKEERLTYRHFFNERSQKKLFYGSFSVQKKLGLSRKTPKDLQIQIGSQWWCLRRRTVEMLLKFIKQRKDVMRFFKTTWIPDETFFQTLVHHLVPENEIWSRSLTFLIFSDYGMPVTFYNDHYDMLLAQDYLFARKISPEADELKQRLGDLYISEKRDFVISDEGRSLFKFLTQRGRDGRRFGPRIWQDQSSIGRDRELLILVCKKWHIAKRLARRLWEISDIQMLEHLFDEENIELPNLGGIEATMAKRTRHNRALMRLLFDRYEVDRMLICLDPSRIGLLQDFYGDQCKVKILEINCDYDDEFLVGHARRIGLAGENPSEDSLNRLILTIRNDIEHESRSLRDAGFSDHGVIKQSALASDNIAPLAKFLDVEPQIAEQLLLTDQLFKD